MIGAAVLCTSELTTNALLHAGTAARVQVDLSAERLLVAVSDSGTRGAVTRARTETLSSRGRGLGLIEELSDAWGTDPAVRGSTVWFEILIRGDPRTGMGYGHEPPAGVLFDVDGTLVDSTYLHAVTLVGGASAPAGHDVPIAADPPGRRDGRRPAARPPARPGARPVRRRVAAGGARRALRAVLGRLRPLPGAADLLRACHERGQRVALAVVGRRPRS